MASNTHYTRLDMDEGDGVQEVTPPKMHRDVGRPFFNRMPRPFVFWLAGGILVVLIASAVFAPSEKTINDVFTKLGSPHCPAECPTDPFVKSGTMHFGTYDNETRWIPFPHEPMDALQHPLNSEDIEYSNVPSQEALDDASPQYMKMLASGSEGMEWARDKTVLFVGSSHDRNNVQFFCELVGGKITSIGGHTGGFCHVAAINLTVVNWFLYGMVDGEFDWFENTEQRPHKFEGRIDKWMLPMMEKYQIGRPDLIIESSLFWDDKFLNMRGNHFKQKPAHAKGGVSFSELIWHRSRVHALIHRTRELYGADVPIMFRTRHFRHDNQWARILRIFQLDQSMRAIAEELGIKLFVWGGKLEGVTDEFYDGDQHFKKGSATWLFGDMMLFYLKRATTKGCWKCHQWRD